MGTMRRGRRADKRERKRWISRFMAALMILAELVGMTGITAVAETVEFHREGGFFREQHTAGKGKIAGTGATESGWQEDCGKAPKEELVLATSANLKRDLTAGDLWDGWNGISDFPGDGTKTHPYQIDSLAELMGLSELVAAGNDCADTYFELTGNIDLGGIETNYGNWNPIGWYRNKADLASDGFTPFRGHFDGRGYRISGLKIVNPELELKNIGLFGMIENGSVKHLIVEADDLYGVENGGILAGSVRGASVIQDVKVSGYVYSEEDAGGIAAETVGRGASPDGRDRVVIENCMADGVILNSSGREGFVGGIAGNTVRTHLVDNVVRTQNGDSNRVQGKGYVGGIAGRMRETDIYNSYVSGTIGGNGSRAAGGMVGKYESGNLILARMAGEISRTNNGSASREGTFVGTRESRHNFTYGTEKDSRMAYLYTNSAVKAKNVFGSKIDGDNQFTAHAHIGYWTDLERKYAVLSERMEEPCGDRYFYEELEDGVRYIVTRKLGNEFTAEGYSEGLAFRPDHFAPGYMGEPVRGYLVYVPRIDAENANGTFDTDVAVLTAIAETGSSYCRPIDKDSAAAIAPGAVVTVSTAPKNTEKDRYQMIVDENEPGGVRPPTYLNEDGEEVPMQYENGGAYSFIMPEKDTVLKAEYGKVTTRLTVDPAQTRLRLVMTRSGDRKHPSVVTEVKNDAGILIARYIDGVQDQLIEVQPVAIHAEHNGSGGTADRTVRWSVDDGDLLQNCSEAGYTESDGLVLPNVNSRFVQEILQREIKAQAENQYREPIRDTVYTRYAVVTAVTNPDTSANNQPVYGNCRVAVEFQIVDNTTVRVEKMTLNKPEINLIVTRRLTGDGRNPKESIVCSPEVVLTAALEPKQPFLKQVRWQDRESGKLLILESGGQYNQDCRIQIRFDPEGKENPAWIQNLINQDRKRKEEKPGEKIETQAEMREIVTAASEDQTHGNVTADCLVTLKFVTIDETRLWSIGGSGGSSGGSSGGGSSRGVTAGGNRVASGQSLPEYAVTGTWMQNAAGNWMFADKERTYAGEWAAVHNPYASLAAGQSAFDWFRFDDAGFMVTGWYQDTDGNHYYLNPSPDGTRGRMVTGWNWIGGNCYYFQEISDGTMGALKRNFTAPDGKQTNQDGVWVVDGVVQAQK